MRGTVGKKDGGGELTAGNHLKERWQISCGGPAIEVCNNLYRSALYLKFVFFSFVPFFFGCPNFSCGFAVTKQLRRQPLHGSRNFFFN